MKKIINNFLLWMTIFLCVTVLSCEQEDYSLSDRQGTLRLVGISLEFVPMGSPGSRIEVNSPWVHVFSNSAELIFTNKATGQQYIQEYDPNDFSLPYSIDLPFGEYEYRSIVVGGIFSAFVPFEARGEFSLDSQKLEFTLVATSDYGLVSVKNQYVENASISDGGQESDLVLHQDSTYWFLYVKDGTAATLNIRESIQGSTISRELNIEANRHYNFILKLNENGVAIIGIFLAPFELVEEEITLDMKVFFEENGIIKCTGAIPGEKGRVNVKVYEAVDRELLIQRKDEGADLSCVCTSLVTDMSSLFSNQNNFNQPIENWDVSNLTNMHRMFTSATSFNQPIGKWDVSNVTNMNWMFYNATSFNQPLENWNVSNVTNMSEMFAFATSFNQSIADWNVGNVSDMKGMFNSASTFNQPIENWDVSNVTDMSGMFAFATSFN
ncbi:MAG TPA: BspA family leucine-rich repeat surface protein, partial [Anditalea sp.]|nr:BspA family leucine-rich repeat surface protein [Anditalea sp.]